MNHSNSFMSQSELAEYGFRHLGENVKLSRKASIYGAENISLSDHCRIDDFCILSGEITIGAYCHIAAYTGLFAGDYGIEIGDYAGISSRCAVYAASGDYLGFGIPIPTVPSRYRHDYGGKITFGKHALIGTGCTVLPGVTIGEGTSVAAMSLVNKSLDPWCIYWKVSQKKGPRERERILAYERELLNPQE